VSETLTVNAAADALGVSRRTVYYWIRSGYLQIEHVQRGTQYAKRVRTDSAAFGVKTKWRSRKVDKRTAWRLAIKLRKDEAA
jgi:excisionase family DNA binding protein